MQIETNAREIATFHRHKRDVVTSFAYMQVKCPNCGKEVEYHGNPFRPFCSERCKLLDLGAWADEEYSMPAESSEMTEEELQMIERMSEVKQ